MKKALTLSIIAFTSAIFVAANCLLASDGTLDPFGADPKRASPGCKAEDRYKFVALINSKGEFIHFIKNNTLARVKLTNFKGAQAGTTDWDKVLKAVKVQKVRERTVYILVYNPHPGQCSKHTLKMTDDGYVSVYGCCGR
ncbi:MAG: hypothetical protein Q8O22_04285 [Candidatus Omnitrophota bacterium]|nr:hypothetical protein [Candidatus Omnitrophota bacterium]